MRRVTITVPLTPPSVNHYKKLVHVRGRVRFAQCTPAKQFKLAVAMAARGLSVDPLSDAGRRKVKYVLRCIVYLGEKQRGDGDNFWKVVADAIQAAGVIHSDAAVKDWHMYVRRDILNPRTVITAKAYA